jgi:hypothetical protein
VPAMPAYKHRDFHQQPSLIHHQFIGDAYEGLERIKKKKKNNGFTESIAENRRLSL